MITGLNACLAKRENLFGCFVMLPSPAIVEMVGHPGEVGHPQVVAAIEAVVRDVRSVNGPALSTFARTEAEAKSQIGQGFTMICTSTTSLFTRRLADMVEELRR